MGGPKLLKAIQNELLRDLEKGAIVKGTGGIRKIRIGKDQSGKSSGYRVFYLNFAREGVTYLMAILDKRDSENISEDEKTVLRAFAKAIKGEQ